MDRNLRLAVERVNAWHLARALARTASETDSDSVLPDIPAEAQPATAITDPTAPLDGAPVEEPASVRPEGRKRMH